MVGGVQGAVMGPSMGTATVAQVHADLLHASPMLAMWSHGYASIPAQDMETGRRGDDNAGGA